MRCSSSATSAPSRSASNGSAAGCEHFSRTSLGPDPPIFVTSADLFERHPDTTFEDLKLVLMRAAELATKEARPEYERLRKRNPTKAVKKALDQRDGHLCQKCGAIEKLEVDHKRALIVGGFAGAGGGDNPRHVVLDLSPLGDPLESAVTIGHDVAGATEGGANGGEITVWT